MGVSLEEQSLGGLRWLVLRGPAEPAFASLGSHLRAEIGDVVGNWPGMARLRSHAASPPGSELLAVVRQASAARFPGIWSELAAMADGAEVALDDLALLNFRGDLGTVRTGAADDHSGCSDLAWRGRQSFLAHNEDLAVFFAGRAVLLTLELDGQPPAGTFWVPGFLPGNTFTVTGDGLAWSLDHLPVSSPGPGAGRHIIARGLQRTATTISQALEFLREHPAAGGFAYTIGDSAGRVVSAEAAAGQFAWREVGQDGPLTWHTNHGRYITGAAAAPVGTSIQRGQVLAALQPPSGEPDAAWFARILAEAPPAGVRADPTPATPSTTLCTFIASFADGHAYLLPRDSEAVSIPLTDLAHSRGQRYGVNTMRTPGTSGALQVASTSASGTGRASTSMAPVAISSIRDGSSAR
jgi:hypothetical protein